MKNSKWLIFVLFLAILAGFIFLKPKKSTKPIVKSENNQEEKMESEIKPIETEKKEVIVNIVSPEEETFSPRQARMWSAKIDNFESEYGNFGFCDWKFYLNENNDEVLYKEETVRTVLSTGGDNTCAFTSTFIEKVGKLRAEVTVRVTDFQEVLKETYKAERNYLVE